MFLLGAAAGLFASLVLTVTVAFAAVPSVTISSIDPQYTTARVSANVEPQGEPTVYRFQYITESQFQENLANSLPGFESASPGPEGSIDENLEFNQGIEGTITGLAPGTLYHLRLVTENGDGPGEAETIFTTLSPIAPVIDLTTASAIGTTSATVNAKINPNGADTHYHFEYTTTDFNECGAPTNPACLETPEGNVGSANIQIQGGETTTDEYGGRDPLASKHLVGLAPGTTYLYRVVATNSAGTEAGYAKTLRTFAPSTGFSLPANRAYELVSPPDKNGANVISSPSISQAAVDGNSFQFSASAGFAESQGIYVSAQYISKRQSDGWKTHSITPNQMPPENILPSDDGFTGYRLFSPDLEKGIVYAVKPIGILPEKVAKVPNIYSRANLLDGGAGSYQLLSNSSIQQPSVVLSSAGARNVVAAASADFSHVIFETPYNLTPEATGSGQKVYESENGTVRLVGILPDSACGTPPCIASTSNAGSNAGNSLVVYTTHMISDDGSRVFFTVPTAQGQFSGSIYARLNHASTVQLNVSEKTNGAGPGGTDSSGPQPARIQAATPDGSKVYFTSEEQLTNDASTGGVYMYDFDHPGGDRLTFLDRGQEVIGVDSGGSYVYYFDRAGGPNTPEEIKVWHQGTISVIGEVQRPSLEHAQRNTISKIAGTGGGSDFRVTPSGTLLYTTETPQPSFDSHNLLPYSKDIADHSIDIPKQCWETGVGLTHMGCEEIYVYDPAVGHSVCASCNPSGEEPVGNAFFTARTDTQVDGLSRQVLSHPITDDGTRVFFDSPDALVAQDSNGHYDVYEYDVPANEVHLLSTGQCACDSLFLDASADGRDVFITTTQSLVRIDNDTGRDVYDARVGGGIAAQNAVPPAECQGDACQAPASPPNDPTPASSNFRGSGNVVEKLAKKRLRHAKKRHHKKHRVKSARRHDDSSPKNAYRVRAAGNNRGGAK